MLTIALRDPVALVPGLSLPQKYAAKRRQYPHLPEPAQLVMEMNAISQNAGIPVSIDDRKKWLYLYAQSGCLGLRPTRHGDAYSIEFVEPMSLRNHGALARSRLRLTGASWIYYGQLRDVPPGWRVPDEEIRTSWTRAQTLDAKPPPKAPSRYDAFFDALDLVIEGGRQIEAAKDPSERILPYYEVRSTGQLRRSAAGVYHFLLSRPGAVQPGAMVQLQNEPDLRGRVRATDGERLTVAFDTAIDRRRIPERGELVVAANDVVQRVQADAVAKLRAGTTLNRRLPAVLVDGAFLGYQEQAVEPSEPLDDNQQKALRRALSVPDLLCVVGPPGTGKTRTIVEIARAAAARGERVLIASQTNTAVDNVIERLPASMTAIRVGNDERISEAVRHRTLGEAAGDLQQRIADRTAVTAQRLDPWFGEPSLAARWLNRTRAELATSEAEIHARDVALRERQAAEVAVTAHFGEPVRASEAFLRETEQGAEQTTREMQQTEDRLHRAEARANGLVGFWHRRAAERYRVRLSELEPQARQKRTNQETARQDYELRRAQLDRTMKDDPAVRAAADRAVQAQSAAHRSDGLARQAAQQLARLLAGVEAAPAPEPDMAAFVSWCQAYMPVLHERATLLLDWRNQLEQPSEQLHAELLRYADVIGSTCIGVGVQRNQLADLDFDLAVVDEAGQIPLPSTLVPLTRARRAVLVGDHHQLPPFVDDDVRQWLAQRGDRDMDAGLVGDLLTH